MEMIGVVLGTEEKTEKLLEEQDRELVDLYEKSVTKLRGLSGLLVFLEKNSVRRCIGTSSRKLLVDILLRRHNLQKNFEFVVSGDMVREGKPNPEIYNLCVSKLGVLPAECLVLEDSLNGIKAGRAAGCFTCAVPSEFTKREDFSSANLVCESLADPKIEGFILSSK